MRLSKKGRKLGWLMRLTTVDEELTERTSGSTNGDEGGLSE